MIYEFVCEYCGNMVSKDYVKPSWIKKGRAPKFCSKKCSSNARKRREIVICAFCEKEFEIELSRKSKRTFVFCSRECKDKAQSIKSGSKFYEMRPKHYGKEDSTLYRKRALEFYGPFCKVCGYSIVNVLEVHHIDGNRRNNKMENLMVLCPTHHVEYQLGLIS